MTKLNLNFNQRLTIWFRLGSLKVPSLKDAAILIRIINKVRPTDEEYKATDFKSTGNVVEYKIPSPSFGIRELEFEDEEASALIKSMENHPEPFVVTEAVWILDLIEDLNKQMSLQDK